MYIFNLAFSHFKSFDVYAVLRNIYFTLLLVEIIFKDL